MAGGQERLPKPKKPWPMRERKATTMTPATEEGEGSRCVEHVKKGQGAKKGKSPTLANPNTEKRKERRKKKHGGLQTLPQRHNGKVAPTASTWQPARPTH
jgi:hypothetical protein